MLISWTDRQETETAKLGWFRESLYIYLQSESTQDFILGHFQSSPRGLDRLHNPTQDCVLGYSQPSLRDCSVAISRSVRFMRLLGLSSFV